MYPLQCASLGASSVTPASFDRLDRLVVISALTFLAVLGEGVRAADLKESPRFVSPDGRRAVRLYLQGMNPAAGWLEATLLRCNKGTCRSG